MAEELPFPDGSVDLLTASSAAHWFDRLRFLDEAKRVLKARGCIALLDYVLEKTRFHYEDCGDRLTGIMKEVGLRRTVILNINVIKEYGLFQVKEALLPHTSSPVAVSQSKLEDIFAAIPFSDKER